jgi:hypothetical protein
MYVQVVMTSFVAVIFALTGWKVKVAGNRAVNQNTQPWIANAQFDLKVLRHIAVLCSVYQIPRICLALFLLYYRLITGFVNNNVWIFYFINELHFIRT